MASGAGPSTGPNASGLRITHTVSSPQVLADEAAGAASKPKKKKHRAGKKYQKKKQRQQQREGQGTSNTPATGSSFYRTYRPEINLSTTSLDSDTLLDHRGQTPIKARRNSRAAQGMLQCRYRAPTTSNLQADPIIASMTSSFYKRRHSRPHKNDDEDEAYNDDPRAPLLAYTQSPNTLRVERAYGGVQSSSSSLSGLRPQTQGLEYDVNNPPSMPGSPVLGGDPGFGDVLEGDLSDRRPNSEGEFVIDIDQDGSERDASPTTMRGMERRHTFTGPEMAEDDVCFPADLSEWASEVHDDDYMQQVTQDGEGRERPRRRRRRWPNFQALDEWAREERAQKKNERLQAKKVREPQYVDGRLRPKLQQVLFQEPEDDINRFTYFNEQFEATIHASSISELVQDGQTFREFFAPEPPVLSDSSDDEDDEDEEPTPMVERKPSQILSEARSEGKPSQALSDARSETSPPGSRPRKQPSLLDAHISINGSVKEPPETSGAPTPVFGSESNRPEKPKKYGNPPAFWLDVMCPTDAEMKLLTHVFNLHPLTTEDIIMRESREKVELFRHYYFVHYRAFDQDPSSSEYMEPVNFYIIVFREGIITFHFAPTPHPAHVRRRIRTLNDYVSIDSDWLCYALIDSITDAYQPVVESIENKVDEIDDAILEMHDENNSDDDSSDDEAMDEKASIKSKEQEKKRSGGNMLKRVGKIRKRTMNLGRLLSTKADVIKQFAKRCTERYEVAPRSDIGLFLGDIQDHIITMQGSLNHYEMILGRAHGNYLAQISFRMNQRQEEASGSLNKLTVLGTIVLPMNIITGMWGMNVLVPGQDIDNLYWFFSITAGLFLFGALCYFAAKKSNMF